MAISAGQVFVDLGARMDRREFEAYERELKRVQERTAKRDRFKAELGAKFDNRAFSAYERELKKADRANDAMVRSNGRLRTSFGSVWSKGGAAFAAAGGAYAVVTAVKSVVGAYGEAEASAKRVATAVDNAGISYKAHREEIDKVIQAQSKLSKFDDEDLADSFARFVTQTKNVNEALRLNALAADVARGRQISLEAAQKLVARASQGNVGALKRLGIEIDPVTKSTDKLKDSTKKVSDAAKDQAKQHDLVSTKQRAVAALQEKFGGQSKAYGKTQQGAIDGLSVAWENLREKLGEKLAPTITDVAGKASKFIDEMTTGQGEGGKFARTLERDVLPALKQIGGAARTGGRLIGRFFEEFNSNERQVGGWISGFGRAESSVLKFTGLLVGGRAGRQLREWGHNVDTNADAIDRWRQELKITREVDKIEDDIRRLRRTSSGSFRDIRINAKKNMDEIRSTMTLESGEGRKAFSRNIRATVTAIRTAMKDGRVSADTGLAQIRKLFLTELKELGIREAERGGAPLSKNPPGKGGPPVTTTRAVGGWIGQQGMAGSDMVPALLGEGEAVLNRHQQAVVEGLLGEGFLDKLFATVQRPHYLATGGRVQRFAGGGLAGATAAANKLERAHFPYHWGGGHQATPAPFGPMDCSGAVSYVLQNAGVNIPTLTSGLLANRGLPGPGALTVFANPVHTFMRIGSRYFGTSGTNPGGGAGWMPDPGGAYKSRFAVRHFGGADAAIPGLGEFAKTIRAPKVALGGMLGQVVQARLDNAAKGATARANELAASIGLGTGDPGDPGPSKGRYGFGDLRELWTSVGGRGAASAIMARIALAESGGNPKARNPSGASGLWQILGLPFPGDPFDPATNARMALSKSSNGANLRPWDASRAAWGRFAARGGRFAKGGKAGTGGERAWLNQSWAQVAPLFGLPADSSLGSLFKHIRLSKDNPFVGVTSDPGAKGHGTDELLWPRWLWQSSKGQKALDDKSKLQLFIHEMAHRFQSRKATSSEWESEGGAEAFARLAMDRQFGGRRSSKGDPYNAFVTRVVKRHGMDWIARTQFGKAMGGVAHYAKGKPGKPSKLVKTVGGATAGLIRKIRPVQTDRSARYDAYMASVEQGEANYGRWEARFNVTDEELVDADTGQINVAAIKRKAKELTQLVFIRVGIERDLDAAQDTARLIVKSYRKVVAALRKSLRHASKKNRKGVQSYINQYTPRIAEWQGKIGEISGAKFEAKTDELSLRRELKDVLGTTPEVQDADTSAAADSGADTSFDTTADTTGDTTTAPPTPLQIAEAAATEMRTFLSGRQDLLTSFGRNFVPQSSAAGVFGAPDPLTAAAGVRAFGGASAGGLGGATIIANFASAPDNAPTFVQQIRFIAEGG